MARYSVTVEVRAQSAQAAKQLVQGAQNPRTTAPDYMMQLINYGGTMIPRGVAYQKLINVAKAQGHANEAAKVLADRWMQGYDLRHK